MHVTVANDFRQERSPLRADAADDARRCEQNVDVVVAIGTRRRFDGAGLAHAQIDATIRRAACLMEKYVCFVNAAPFF